VKGCAFNVLLSLLGLAAIVGAISFGLDRLYGLAPRDTIVASVLGGVGGWIVANLLLSALTTWRERGALVNGLAGTTPVDGRRAVLVGEIQPVGASLVAPFSGSECVAYTFEIYRISREFRQATKVVCFDGVALTPSVIVTRAGSFRLLAVPDLDCEETQVSSEVGRQRAADFIARTTFETPAPGLARPSIERQWNDDDGAYQRDMRRVTEDVNLVECTLSEKRIPRGARVCVFGQYSQDRRAIVADPNDWSKMTRLMIGDAGAIVRQLRSRAIGRLVGALIAAAVVVGGLAAFVSSSGST
jgi:TM2 domain-containing membrane protein YozV